MRAAAEGVDTRLRAGVGVLEAPAAFQAKLRGADPDELKEVPDRR